MKKTPHLIAAVDLGSNSFRLIVGRVEENEVGSQIYPLDQLKEPVRIAAGLDEQKVLSEAAITRGVEALQRFAERIRSFSPGHVRAVGTNTFRVAKNLKSFLPALETALGFPIEVIGGREEARLIYLGVAHDLPSHQGNRLVVDIGGGSTEFIIGRHYAVRVTESLFLGCVSYSQRFFPDGVLTAERMQRAVLAARREIQTIAQHYNEVGWQVAAGSSGTAKALLELIEEHGLASNYLTPEAMRGLGQVLVHGGHIDAFKSSTLKPDRLPVLPGGYAIMMAVFEELGIEQMQVSESGLRQGVLYDVLGREQHHDVRQVTVAQFMRRYGVDTGHAQRVSALACTFYRQLLSEGAVEEADAEDSPALQQLDWAACLHEIGLAISHDGYHKHSAYVVAHSDMPGFSRKDQLHLSNLLLAHAGKLGKLLRLLPDRQHWPLVLALRLAVLFYRRRVPSVLPPLQLTHQGQGFSLHLPAGWLNDNPLTEFGLRQEISEWSKMDLTLELAD
ncbi:MAG: Ppx/GppA family phosphatase [Burkholderiaceae bacterium]|nr:MAG: Ppx/GppA family phosphatase [Burkholderiaceae bacterium]